MGQFDVPLQFNLSTAPLPTSTYPLQIERTARHERRLIREQKHVRSSAFCNRIECREHPLDAFLRGRHSEHAKVLKAEIMYVPLLPIRLIVREHFFREVRARISPASRAQ